MAIKTSGKYKGGLPIEAHSHERPHIGGPLGDRINSASPADLKKFRSDLAKMDKQGKNVVAERTPTGKPVLEISPKIVMQHVDDRLRTAVGGAFGRQQIRKEAQAASARAGVSLSEQRLAKRGRASLAADKIARERSAVPVGPKHGKLGEAPPRGSMRGQIQTSAKGARYYVNASGNKVYVK